MKYFRFVGMIPAYFAVFIFIAAYIAVVAIVAAVLASAKKELNSDKAGIWLSKLGISD